MSDIAQIVISFVEQPVEVPLGEVYKVSIFDTKICVDNFYCNTAEDALEMVKSYIGDLRSA